MGDTRHTLAHAPSGLKDGIHAGGRQTLVGDRGAAMDLSEEQQSTHLQGSQAP